MQDVILCLHIILLKNNTQSLLEVVHDLFEEQTSLEKVILKIMQRAQRLLKCERAAVLLLDDSVITTQAGTQVRSCSLI